MAKSMDFPKVPKVAVDFPDWFNLVLERIDQAFPFASKRCRQYYEEILAWKGTDGKIDHPLLDAELDEFALLDRQVKWKLEQTFKNGGGQNAAIRDELSHTRRRLKELHNSFLTSRRIIAVINNDVAACESVVRTDYLTRFTQLGCGMAG